MGKLYFTLTGTKNYFGKEFLKKGTKIRLEKEIKGDWQMKGYNTSNGYMGYVEDKYILFASEQEYFEFMED